LIASRRLETCPPLDQSNRAWINVQSTHRRLIQSASTRWIDPVAATPITDPGHRIGQPLTAYWRWSDPGGGFIQEAGSSFQGPLSWIHPPRDWIDPPPRTSGQYADSSIQPRNWNLDQSRGDQSTLRLDPIDPGSLKRTGHSRRHRPQPQATRDSSTSL
jgi:hypothetical protein